MPKYFVCSAWDDRELEASVDEKLAEGWVCQGGVTAVQLPSWGSAKLYQAMVWEKLSDSTVPDKKSTLEY